MIILLRIYMLLLLTPGCSAKTTLYWQGPSLQAMCRLKRCSTSNRVLPDNLQEEINVQAGATIRYDFYYWEFPNGQDGDPVNTFYFDVNGFISKSIYKSLYAGIGFTQYNIGKDLTYSVDSKTKTLQLEFNSIDFLIGIKVKKIFIEPKLSIVQKDFPGTIKDNATLLGIRICYMFFGSWCCRIYSPLRSLITVSIIPPGRSTCRSLFLSLKIQGYEVL